jgi:hypothetical protein
VLRRSCSAVSRAALSELREISRRDENPFEPRREGVPLALTLDGRSLSAVTGEAGRERDLLLGLTSIPLLDVLVLDWTGDLPPDILQGRLADPDLEQDTRVVKHVGSGSGFFGSVQPWSSRERRVDQLGLEGAEREWFLYYEAVTWYHRNSSRHLFVTADRRLLRELAASPTDGPWANRRIITVLKALELVGLVMRSRDLIYLEAEGNYTRSTSAYTYYFELSYALAPARVRLRRWLDEADSTLPREELADLEQSMFDRVGDLLRARDAIVLQCMRTRQDSATLDEILYHLRGGLLTASALADSIAVFAQLALRVDAGEVGGVANISLAERGFRRAIRDAGGRQLAERAAASGPMWKAMRMLRNPVAHRSGVAGVTYHRLPGPSESRITLTPDQATALERAAQQHGDSPAAWGLDDKDEFERRLDPLLFINAFVPHAISLLDDLVGAFADDLAAPAAEPAKRKLGDDIWKLALLGGLSGRVRTAC